MFFALLNLFQLQLAAPPKPPPLAIDNAIVVLQGVVDAAGRLTAAHVMQGGAHYVAPSLDSVRLWSFGQRTEIGEKVGITFLYRGQMLLGAPPFRLNSLQPGLPTVIVDPGYPVHSVAEGVVILEVHVGSSGRAERIDVVRPEPSLTDTAIQAVRQWAFVPVEDPLGATHIVVISFLRPA
jgi:TonB family protein